MEEFAHLQNVVRFRRDLERETDPIRRAVIEDLLKEELVQLARIRVEKARAR